MSKQQEVLHHYTTNTALPYVTFDSPLGDAWAIEQGENVLTSLERTLERFPGFATQLIPPPSGGWPTNSTINRIHIWRRWAAASGAWIGMVSVLDGADTKVYKYEAATDTNSVLIHTASATTTPFDFVVANDWCFFGNGSTQANMRKWQSGSTSYLWGIAKPAAKPTVAVTGSGNTGLLAPTAAAGSNWTNPTNVFTSDNSYAVYNTTTQDDLRLTTFAASVPVGSTIAGVIVEIEGNGTSATAADRQIQVGLTTDGTTLVGVRKTTTLNQTTDTTLTLGSATDTWSATLTQANTTTSTFGVLIRDADTTGAALNLDLVRVRIYYTITSTLDGSAGYHYVYTYGNSTTGQQSSPSPISDCTGTFTDNQVSVTVVASADPQVDEIHIFRTTDGGSEARELMQEITGSPAANASATVADTTEDTDLSDNSAPGEFDNDPPPPSRNFLYSKVSGRIWALDDNRAYYSGYEEIDFSNGVPEESFPGGSDGNYYVFSDETINVAETQSGVAIFTPSAIHAIDGDSLDTLRRYKLLDRRGTRSRTAVTSLGGDVCWFDTSGTVWISSLGEVGLPIRSDTSSINPATAFLTLHIGGKRHWLVLTDGANGDLYVFDLDTRQWMPPRNVGTTIGCITSGETTSGTIDLALARNGSKILKMVEGSFVDDGSAYTAFAELSLAPIHSEGGPSWRGVVDWVEIEYSGSAPSSLGLLLDEDPSGSVAHTSLNTVAVNDLDLPQGTDLLVTRYGANPGGYASGSRIGLACRRASLRFDWAAANNNFRLLSIDLCYHPIR